MENLVVDRIPADTLIVICLFAGAVARLMDGAARSPMAAIRELFFGIILGAFITGLASKCATTWKLRDFWFVAGLATFFAGIVVGIVEKKAVELREMPLAEATKLIVSGVWGELKKYLPKSKDTGAGTASDANEVTEQDNQDNGKLPDTN